MRRYVLIIAGVVVVAWGVLAPHLPQNDPFAPALLRDALARTGVPGERSLLTPTCGSGLVAPSRDREMAALLGALGAELEPARVIT